MNTEKIPNPWYVEKYMNDESMTLEKFDEYLHPGIAGAVFHDYSSKFTKKLEAYGIKTFIDLKNEFEKVQAKKSNLPSTIRTIVQGHYTYYMNELRASKATWEALAPENLEEAKKHEYLVRKISDSDPSSEEQEVENNETKTE